MAGRSGGAERLTGFFAAGLSTLLRLATLFDSRVRGLQNPAKRPQLWLPKKKRST
ncbi:MAG TPA: hypothetical protein ACHBZ9_22660 [Arsenophonus nasoniae]|uniref:hypothetical protein n=1 Tax=Arsenophonus nasoniae TaxID=638 RepID=UPI00387A805E